MYLLLVTVFGGSAETEFADGFVGISAGRSDAVSSG